MNGETYSMQWMQRGMQRIRNSSQQLIIDSQREAALLDVVESERVEQRMSNDATHYLTNGTDDMQYIVASTVGDVDLSSATLEQMAAENLIFMARDGQMEILSTDDADGTVVVSASGNAPLDCAAVMQQIAKSMLSAEADGNDDGGTGNLSADCTTSMGEEDHYNEDYNDSTPQMVTEEVITDDWVQSQGEDRVEISAEQIIGSNSQVLLDMEEVPLPTVQDEYSALRPFPCDFCSRRFRKKASLMNHMVAHQTDRSLLCKLCGLRFSHRSTLINHLKAHAEQDQDFDNEMINFTDPSHATLQSNVNSNYFNENDWQQEINTENAEVIQKEEVNSKTSTSKSTRSRIGRLKSKSIKNKSCENLSQNGQSVMQNIKIERDSEIANDQNVFPVLDDNKPFVCQNCGLAFARQKALLSHVKTHSNDSPYECPTCGDVFWDKSDLQEHQRVHTFEESNSEYEPEPEVDETHSEMESDNLYGDFYCSECGLCFHRQDLLRRHAKLHCKTSNNANRNQVSKPTPTEVEQNNNNHCCNTCGQTFSSALELLAHAELHTRYPAFKCVLCGETFSEENAIKSHLQSTHAHEMTQNSCILCGKECRDRRALIKHAWDHSREKCHTCSKCGKSFHNKARLKRHMASHRDKTVTCDVCHEEFPDGRTLSNHRHSHSTTSAGKLFPCNVCGKTFGSRSSQQIHVRIHTGERPYGCRYCWKAFADGGTLRKHERIHTGEKPYACSVCPRAFNQRVVLREHIRSHHSRIDVKRGTFFCSACSAELPSSAELLQHLIEHSDAITAMQRQPVTGPRKYKRRRKLKPHELAKFRSEGKTVSENTSEVDLSDFEMEQADDMVDMSGSSDATMQQNSMNNSNKNKIEHNSLKTDNQSRRRSTRGSNKSIYTDIEAKSINMQEDDTHLDLDILDYMSDKKKRLDSTNSNCSEKLWPSSSSLLSNVENTLQTIETLVVSNKKSNEKRNIKPTSPKSGNKKPSLIAFATKKEERNVPTRARMIYTEKTTIETLSTKRRGKKGNSVITTNMVVSDYEIISPSAQPPAEISSNNVTIKQEVRSEAGTLRADLFDAQLLLEASTLRKDQFEKFNPSIVNDLEEILRSPHKSGDQRRRFTSESSATQFLTEQSEEEQTHMIKIEPTSPDLRELISTPQSNTRSLRQTRELSINRKYLDFETPHQHHTRLRTPTKDSSTSYLVDFGTNTFDNPSVSPGNSSTDVTAAATAAAAAAEAAVSSSSSLSPEQRKTRYFECEMCSSIFSDRAQLLDHVNIHI